MKTAVLEANLPASMEQAAAIIVRGGLVAFPTETVYGLGADALSGEAVRKIFTAKNRPAWDPVIVHVSSRQMLSRVGTALPPRFDELFDRFMPGPLTLLVQKSEHVPSEVTAGRPLVAVRFPRHTVAQALIAAADVPIAAPSANRFGRTSPTTAQHVLADLGGRIDAVLDGGATSVGVESTVLDLTSDPPAVLRQGSVTREQLEQVLGTVRIATQSEVASISLLSPGMSPRHYAPRARLIVIEGGEAELRAAAAQHRNAGILLPTDWFPWAPSLRGPGLKPRSTTSPANAAVTVFDWGHWNDHAQLAARLYAGLRWLDERNVDVILAPLPRDEGLGSAIRDRLLRAAK